MDLQPTRLLCLWGFFRQEYWSGLPCPPQGDTPTPGIKPRSPTLQADSLLAELPGKPKNTGVNSLSPLQRIFLNQELNRGLLHCRKIFYQIRLATREAQVWAIIVKLTWFYKRVVIFVGSSENLKQMTDFILESALTHPSTCEFLLFQFHDLTLSSQNPISRYWED